MIQDGYCYISCSGGCVSAQGISEAVYSDLLVCAQQAEVAVDMRQRYVGHCNAGTDIKQASFLGERGIFLSFGTISKFHTCMSHYLVMSIANRIHII